MFTVPVTVWDAGKLLTDTGTVPAMATVPETGCVAGKLATETLHEPDCVTARGPLMFMFGSEAIETGCVACQNVPLTGTVPLMLTVPLMGCDAGQLRM
jgi:hypothetical protein